MLYYLCVGSVCVLKQSSHVSELMQQECLSCSEGMPFLLTSR